MVADFFELAGWETFVLAPHAPDDWLLDAVVRRRADLVAISTSLARYVPAVARSVAALRARSETADVTVMVGGAPFSLAPNLWLEVGAEGTAESASAAVKIANGLLASRRERAAPRTRRTS